MKGASKRNFSKAPFHVQKTRENKIKKLRVCEKCGIKILTVKISEHFLCYKCREITHTKEKEKEKMFNESYNQFMSIKPPAINNRRDYENRD